MSKNHTVAGSVLHTWMMSAYSMELCQKYILLWKTIMHSFSLFCSEITQPEGPHLGDVAATRASLYPQLTSCTDATVQQTAGAQPYQQAKEVFLLRTRTDN